MGKVDLNNLVVNDVDVLSPGFCTTCNPLVVDSSFQSIFSSPKTPNGPGYTVLYTGGTAWLASVTSGFHRTGLPFEAGTYAQFPQAISPTQTGKNQYMFGQIYDKNTGVLYVINDFDQNPLSPPEEMTPDQARDSGLVTTDLLLRYPILNGMSKVVVGSFRKILSALRKLYPWMKAHPWAAIGLLLLFLVIITFFLCGAIFCLFRIEGAWSNVDVTDSPFDETDSRWPTCMVYKMPDGSTWHMEDNQGNLKKTSGPITEPVGSTALKAGLAVGGAFILAGLGIGIARHKPKGGAP